MKDFSEKCESPWNFSWIIPGFLAGTSCPQEEEHINFLMAEGQFLRFDTNKER